MENFVAGVMVTAVLVMVGFGLWDISRSTAFSDLREQCERQGSIRLGKEAMFYCAREPQK